MPPIDMATPRAGELALVWLAQAGFAFQAASGVRILVDPYFSDVVEETFGFKRMMPCPLRPEDAAADLLVCTHEHLDHLDTKALPFLARSPRTHFAGPVECVTEFARAGVPPERRILLEEGTDVTVAGVRLFGVYADHGDLAPDAIGVVLDFDGIRVYHTGDTAYRPERFQRAIGLAPRILLACINGRYGNLTEEEAALLTRDVSPAWVIPMHFWMFVEHGGDPARFLEYCRRYAPAITAKVLKPGEAVLFRSEM